LLPAKGKCKPFTGYFASAAGLITGTACGTSDNQSVKFYLSYGEFNVQWSSSGLIVLDRGSLSGTVDYCFTNGTCHGPMFITQVVCPPPSSRPFK
jgi:hypothetical protein